MLTAQQNQLLPLLCPLPDQAASIYELLQQLDNKVRNCDVIVSPAAAT